MERQPRSDKVAKLRGLPLAGISDVTAHSFSCSSALRRQRHNALGLGMTFPCGMRNARTMRVLYKQDNHKALYPSVKCNSTSLQGWDDQLRKALKVVFSLLSAAHIDLERLHQPGITARNTVLFACVCERARDRTRPIWQGRRRDRPEYTGSYDRDQ